MIVINNFRLVYGKCTTDKPPHLIEYKIINGYQVFTSEFSPLIIVIFDHINNLYCVLERTDESVITDKDIKANIGARLSKIE